MLVCFEHKEYGVLLPKVIAPIRNFSYMRRFSRADPATFLRISRAFSFPLTPRLKIFRAQFSSSGTLVFNSFFYLSIGRNVGLNLTVIPYCFSFQSGEPYDGSGAARGTSKVEGEGVGVGAARAG